MRLAIVFLLFAGLIWADEPQREPASTRRELQSTIAGSATKPLNPHQGSGAEPHFSVYFDLLLVNQPGKANFSFANFHPLLFFEILPTPEIQFAFEVRSDPRYFELDYQITPTIQLRAGKIWIPFDDMNPHNIYGGRIDTSRMRLGGDFFLPDIWTDLGVGAKFTLSETAAVTSEGYLYAVNGIPQLGSTMMPNFADQGVGAVDYNSDKALGGRLHFLFSRVFGLGVSYYTCRWNDESTTNDVAYRLTMAGLDASLRMGNTSFKVGGIGMWVALPSDLSYRRHGAYLELSQRFSDSWRFYVRGGELDTDDRITDVNDVVLIGGGLAYKPGTIQLSLDYQQDIKTVPGKLGYSFSSARVAIQL